MVDERKCDSRRTRRWANTAKRAWAAAGCERARVHATRRCRRRAYSDGSPERKRHGVARGTHGPTLTRGVRAPLRTTHARAFDSRRRKKKHETRARPRSSDVKHSALVPPREQGRHARMHIEEASFDLVPKELTSRVRRRLGSRPCRPMQDPMRSTRRPGERLRAKKTERCRRVA